MRTDLLSRECADGPFFGGVVEKEQAERVAGILRSNEMREGHGHALGRSEPVLPVENHAVAAIEKDYRGAGTVIFALVNHQVRVSHLDGDFGAFAADRIEE